MKVILELPDYDGNGVDVIWDNGSKYELKVFDNEIALLANKNGLVSLAKQMLYLAYNDFDYSGTHVHFDSFFTKMDNIEYELIIEKI